MINDFDHEPLVPPALIRFNTEDMNCYELRERSTGVIQRDILHSNDEHTGSTSLKREPRSTMGGVVSQFNQLRPKKTALDRMSSALGSFIRRVFHNNDRRFPLLESDIIAHYTCKPPLSEEAAALIKFKDISNRIYKSPSTSSVDSLTRIQFERVMPAGYENVGLGRPYDDVENSSAPKQFLPGIIPISMSKWNKRRQRLTLTTTSKKYQPLKDYVSEKRKLNGLADSDEKESLRKFSNWQAIKRHEKNCKANRAYADHEYNEDQLDSSVSSDDDWDPCCSLDIDTPRSSPSDILGAKASLSVSQSMTNLYQCDQEFEGSKSSRLSSRLCYSSLAAVGWEEAEVSHDNPHGNSGENDCSRGFRCNNKLERVPGIIFTGPTPTGNMEKVQDKEGYYPIGLSCPRCKTNLTTETTERRDFMTHVSNQTVVI